MRRRGHRPQGLNPSSPPTAPEGPGLTLAQFAAARFGEAPAVPRAGGARARRERGTGQGNQDSPTQSRRASAPPAQGTAGADLRRQRRVCQSQPDGHQQDKRTASNGWCGHSFLGPHTLNRGERTANRRNGSTLCRYIPVRTWREIWGTWVSSRAIPSLSTRPSRASALSRAALRPWSVLWRTVSVRRDSC